MARLDKASFCLASSRVKEADKITDLNAHGAVLFHWSLLHPKRTSILSCVRSAVPASLDVRSLMDEDGPRYRFTCASHIDRTVLTFNHVPDHQYDQLVAIGLTANNSTCVSTWAVT